MLVQVSKWHFPLSQNGQTPLIIAAEKGNVEIVHELLKRNVQVNVQDEVCN